MDIEAVTAPEHHEDEAPVSSELREKASENLDTIKQIIEEARAGGTLTPEDEAVLRDWLTQDVQAPALEADQKDAEREAILASGIATPYPKVIENGVIMSPEEASQIHQESGPTSGAGRVNN